MPPVERCQIVSGDLLRTLMQRPPGGAPLNIRTLAVQVGLSKSKISALLTGDRPSLDRGDAEKIAEAVGIHTDGLFMPIRSTITNMDTE